jgi:hypothetical protein
MGKYLFTVDAAFDIKGRGIVLAPGIPGRHTVRRGDRIELRTPNGEVVRTEIIGLELIGFLQEDNTIKDVTPIVIKKMESEILKGTEVWLII